MEILLIKVASYWRIITASVLSILWIGRLHWRVSNLEKEARKPKMLQETCKEARNSCQEDIKADLAHLTAQMDFLLQHLVLGDIDPPKKK